MIFLFFYVRFWQGKWGPTGQKIFQLPFFSPMCNWLLGKVLCRRYPPSLVDSSFSMDYNTYCTLHFTFIQYLLKFSPNPNYVWFSSPFPMVHVKPRRCHFHCHPQEPLGRCHPSSAAPFRPAPLAASRSRRHGGCNGHGAGGGFQRARGQRVARGAPKWTAGRSTWKLEVSGCLRKCLTITQRIHVCYIYGNIYHQYTIIYPKC